MRFKLFMLFTVIFLLFAVSMASVSADLAAQETCSALVEQALIAVGNNCGEMGRNTACYGYNRVNATFSQDMPSGFFSRPADITELRTLNTLTTAPLDESTDTWGVAVMKVQANLPTTLPGQAVTLLLLGDASVQNAVSPESAFIPTAKVLITTDTATDLHSGAGLNTNIVARVDAGTSLTADAISADQRWVRAATNTTGGWLPTTALEPVDLTPLPVMDSTQYAPMQAFYFQTGLDGVDCIDAPNAVVVQGPQNFEIAINVNGAEININSTVQLISMREAPEHVLDDLPLPPSVLSRLSQQYGQAEDGAICRIQHLRVISGHARLNNNTILPAGNAAWSAYCVESELELAPEAPRTAEETMSEMEPNPSSALQPPSIAPSTREQIVSFISEWGAFRSVNEEELASIQVLERLPENLMNYPIELPEPDAIEAPTAAGA